MPAAVNRGHAPIAIGVAAHAGHERDRAAGAGGGHGLIRPFAAGRRGRIRLRESSRPGLGMRAILMIRSVFELPITRTEGCVWRE